SPVRTVPDRQAQRRGHRSRPVAQDRARSRRRPGARAKPAWRVVPADPALGGFMRPSVLVVDDERLFPVLSEGAPAAEGFAVPTAQSLARARIALDQATPDVVILDRRLPDGDGIEFLREMRDQGHQALVIVVTAYADVDNAVAALKAGAVDYLSKPVQV